MKGEGLFPCVKVKHFSKSVFCKTNKQKLVCETQWGRKNIFRIIYFHCVCETSENKFWQEKVFIFLNK